jgi:Flp pilus assembly protein TadG
MRRLIPRRRDEAGAVIVIMAAFTVVMVGMAALVIDVGALHDEKRQLQNGADAAAIGLAQYVGQACPTAVNLACTTAAIQGKADALATANVRDGTTTVVPTLDYATKRVTVKTNTLGAGGTSIVPFSFAQILTGVKGKAVKATAVASWAGLQTATVVRLTLSRCEFNLATTDGTIFGVQKTIFFHKSSPICAAGPSGANLPGGFGWLDDNDSSPNDCSVTLSAADTVGSDTGNSNPGPCNMATYLGQDILLSIFDVVSGNGSGGSYHIYGFAQLHMTGYAFPAGGNGGVVCNKPCLVGNFIRFVAIGEFGGPNLGNRVSLVS